MNNEYLDHLAHARTEGAVNGVSHTPGYTAVGKPAMSEAERQARRKAQRERNKYLDAGKDVKNAVDSLGNFINVVWRPKGNPKKLDQYRTRDIEEMNRRARAVEEYYNHYPTRAQKGKNITMGILAGVGSLSMAVLAGVGTVAMIKGMREANTPTIDDLKGVLNF